MAQLFWAAAGEGIVIGVTPINRAETSRSSNRKSQICLFLLAESEEKAAILPKTTFSPHFLTSNHLMKVDLS